MNALHESATNRAQAYHLLAEPFRFPRGDETHRFVTGHWGVQLHDHLESLGLANGDPPLKLDADTDDYEVEFIGLFEVGMGGAPCPLHSGYYGRNRMRDLEEVVRFYRFFGYDPQRTSDRFPDHLAFELDFMAHLARREVQGDDELASLRLAERDFCARHLAVWIPELRKAVEARAHNGFIKGVVRCTDVLVGEDIRNLDHAAHEGKDSMRL